MKRVYLLVLRSILILLGSFESKINIDSAKILVTYNIASTEHKMNVQ